jgi:hypothetical protein
VFFLTTGDADGFRLAIANYSLHAVLPDCVQFLVADAYQRVAHIHAIFLMCWPCTTWGIQCRMCSLLASGDCKVTPLQKNSDACLYYVLKQLAPGDEAVYYLRTGDIPRIAGMVPMPSPGNEGVPSVWAASRCGYGPYLMVPHHGRDVCRGVAGWYRKFDRRGRRYVNMTVRPGGNRAPIITTGDSADVLADLLAKEYGRDAIYVTSVGCMSHQVCLSGWLGQPTVFVDTTSDPTCDRASVAQQLACSNDPVLDGCLAVVVSDMSGLPALSWHDISHAVCGDGNTAYNRFHPYAVPR